MPSASLPPRWLSFDCYGTLIDWKTGVRRAFRELAHVAEEETEELFDVWERIQWEKIQGDYIPYSEILWSSFREAVEKFGYWCPGYAGEAFVESLGRWEPFPDVNPALKQLAKRYRLAIISNVDRHLLGGSVRHFPVRFDALITAEDAHAYKPSPEIFRCALERMGCRPDETAHIAFGAEYDLAAAKALGFRAIFLNRAGTPGAGAAAATFDAEIHGMAELPALWPV